MKTIILLTAATLVAVPAVARAQAAGGAQVQSSASVDASAGSKGVLSANEQTQVNADLSAPRASHDALVRAGHEHPSDEETARGARLIARGYTAAQIESVGRRAPSDRSLAAAFETMASLQARGVSTTRATAQVEQQLATHASDAQLRDITLDANAAAGAGALGAGVGGAVGGVLRARP